MEIVDYNEDKKTLSVRYNTSAVWRYSPVDKKLYELILKSESPQNFISNVFHNSNVVGVVKYAN